MAIALGLVFAAILGMGVYGIITEDRAWADPKHKSCWKCVHRLSPGVERFACAKKMVWTVGFFNGVKYYDMDSLRVRDYFCKKFKRKEKSK